MSVILETTLGDLTVDLYCEERPNCAKNFLKLCKVKYFNFCLFHSVQKNSVAQTGDPSGTGRGGESIFGRLYGAQASAFDAETKPRIKHRKRGQLSMVNDGRGQHTSQFLVTLGEDLDYLDEQQHSVFGEVAEGWDTLDKLNELYCDKEHRPYQDVRISHTVVLDDPFPDPDGLEVPDRSPEPDPGLLASDRIGAHERLDDTAGLTEEEVRERMERREAESNEQLLRIVEDIPDVEGITPNERSLFVCKLNPVTTSEDLEVIFSRFGNIKECSVVKDFKTDASLQYAFIEFERREDCENAYFKMENVLIDDRRIHVDFSQSLYKELVAHKKSVRRTEGGPKRPPRPGPSDSRPGFDFVFDDEEERPKRKKEERKRRRSRSREERRRKSRSPKDRRKPSEEGRRRRSPEESRKPLEEGRRRRSPEESRKPLEGRRRRSPEESRKPPEEGRRRRSPEESRKPPEEGRRRRSPEESRKPLEEGRRRRSPEESRKPPEEGRRRRSPEESRKPPEEGRRRRSPEESRKPPEEGRRRKSRSPKERRKSPEEGRRGRSPEEGRRRKSRSPKERRKSPEQVRRGRSPEERRRRSRSREERRRRRTPGEGRRRSRSREQARPREKERRRSRSRDRDRRR